MHHRYGGVLAPDLSGHGNHGVPAAQIVPDGPAYLVGALAGAVSVPIQGRVDLSRGFRLLLRYGRVRQSRYHALRYRLALVVVDGVLRVEWRHGTVYVAVFHPDRQVWSEITFEVWGEEEWQTLEVVWDGVSALSASQGNAGAGIHTARGPIAEIGPGGLRVGMDMAGPIGTLEGQVGEILLFAHDPTAEIAGLLDRCCWNEPALEDLVRRLQAEGWDTPRLRDLADRLTGLGAEAAAVLRADDAARTEQIRERVASASLAVATGDRTRLRSEFETLDTMAPGAAPPGAWHDVGRRFLDTLMELPWDGALAPTVRDLCLDGLLPPEAEEVPRPRDDEGEDGDRRRPGGSDVDRPEGEPPADWDVPASDPRTDPDQPPAIEEADPADGPSDGKER